MVRRGGVEERRLGCEAEICWPSPLVGCIYVLYVSRRVSLFLFTSQFTKTAVFYVFY
jgi:hypothetical protein